jgi:hypothetical protein
VASGGGEMGALLEYAVLGAMLIHIREPPDMRRSESPSRVAGKGGRVVRTRMPVLDRRVKRL